MTTLNISGIIVHAAPDRIDEVRDSLTAIPGVEVHGASELGKMVVTLEKRGDQETADTFQQISQLPGVLSSAMVYHHFEPEEDLIR
jgi:nitrate reductase NapD